MRAGQFVTRFAKNRFLVSEPRQVPSSAADGCWLNHFVQQVLSHPSAHCRERGRLTLIGIYLPIDGCNLWANGQVRVQFALATRSVRTPQDKMVSSRTAKPSQVMAVGLT
jgi:hypothetical protein